MLRLPDCRIEHLDLSFNMLHSDGINELCKVFLKPAGHQGKQQRVAPVVDSDLIMDDEV